MENYQTKFVNHYVRPYLGDTPRKKYTLAGLSIATIIIFGLLGIRPALLSALTARNTLMRGEHYSQELASKISALKQVEESLIRYQTQVKLLAEPSSSIEKISTVVEKITLLAGASGVRFDYYQKEAVASEGPPHLRFWVGLSGDPASLNNFLRRVKTVDPLLQVESISLSQNKVTTATILFRKY